MSSPQSSQLLSSSSNLYLFSGCSGWTHFQPNFILQIVESLHLNSGRFIGNDWIMGNVIAWNSPPAALHRCVYVSNEMCLYVFAPFVPLRNWYLHYKLYTEQKSHRWSRPVRSSGPHTAGVAQQGQPHASLVRSSNVTSTFSNLYLSNLWHYRELPAVAMRANRRTVFSTSPAAQSTRFPLMLK